MTRGWWVVAALLMVAACGENSSESLGPIVPTDPQPVPSVGQSSFVSADGREGQATRENGDSNNNADAASPAADEASGAERSVEEGDIYQVSESTGLILNLNAYRGLQIIDFNNPAKPEIIGRIQVSGTPVEMYQVGDRLFMLLNNWRGYYGSREDIKQLFPETFEGGVVLVADVSNPAAPKVTARAQVPGWIRTSRLTRGSGQEALYVVSQQYGDSGQETFVKSFSVSSAGKLSGVSDLGLGGYVTDIQATGSRLMVARHDWQRGQGSKVAVIDISSPDGTMIEGASVSVEGMVRNKHNMNIDGDVLRVVSSNFWSSATNTNHVETFDVADIQNISRLDHETFGDNEDLYATIFLGEKAFFVTYRRVDPFHAFHVATDGTLTEKSEFIVSGWNDFFHPVEAETRLVGIGKNDQNGNTMAVSLYDITDLSNPSPMITREEIDLDWSWSEANWDDRAFTVLEKGTLATAPNGAVETGLVLLPFSGWDDQNDTYVSAVQIFTFSKDTLTLRGLMEHGTPVRRSFVADRNDVTTANLSEQELSFFNTVDPDAPSELGRVELAPDYSDFFVFGSHGVRRKNNSGYYGWWGARSNAAPTDDLEVVSLSGDVDSNPAIITIPITAGSDIYKVEEKLVAVSSVPRNANDYSAGWDTLVEVYDFTQPTMATQIGSELYADLPAQGYYNYWGWGFEDCFDCSVSYWGYGGGQNQVVGDSLVFPETIREEKLIGTVSTRYTRPHDSLYRWQSCYDEQTNEAKACSYHSGGISCRQLTRLDGTVEPELCQGQIVKCDQSVDGETTCSEVAADSIRTEIDTRSHPQHRYWYHYDLHVLDLSSPATMPASPTVVSMPRSDEASGLLAREDSLYISFKRPFSVPGDSRPYVKYFFRELDLSNPARPVEKPAVNVPGQLLEVDGSTLLTRDFLWGQSIVESSLNKLELQGNAALLKGVRRFADQEVQQVQVDGTGNVLVTHRTAYLVNRDAYGYGSEEWDRTLRLSVLDLEAPGFPSLSESEVDDWAQLKHATSGRALFTVPGGMLVINIDDPTAPRSQAYFPLRGWPRALTFEGRHMYFAAGPFGLYDFDVDASNLLPSPTN